MRVVLLLSILILTIFLIGKKIFFSAKRNLFKDQAAWSGKDIKIKYSETNEISKSKESPESKGIANYLKIIADESEVYLKDQSREKE